MPTPAERLAALVAASIADATGALARGGSVGAWERAMQAALARVHTATFIAATAQRLGISPDSPLISQSRLSRAERADITAQVQAQLKYLKAFAAQVKAGGLSERAVLARALSYAGSVKAPYYAARWGEWEIPTRLLPGMQQCMGNCLCSLTDVKDNGDGTGTLTRVMGGTERHCSECPGLAGDHEVRRKGAAIKHGTHDQSSHGRRRGGGGGGSAGARRAAEPGGAADVHRQLQNINAELSSRYTSPGRRQALEAQRQALMEAAPRPAATATPPPAPPPRKPPASPPASRQGLRAELDVVEAEIRELRVERGVYFDAKGNRLVDVMGNKNSLSLSQQQFDSLRGVGATATHNHPGGWGRSVGDPRHAGDSFSLADIRQAAALNFVETRVVTPTRRFSMKPPPGGWKDHHWQTTVPKAYKRHDSAVMAELIRQVRAGKMTVEEADARHYHMVWERVAREVGATYATEDR